MNELIWNYVFEIWILEERKKNVFVRSNNLVRAISLVIEMASFQNAHMEAWKQKRDEQFVVGLVDSGIQCTTQKMR